MQLNELEREIDNELQEIAMVEKVNKMKTKASKYRERAINALNEKGKDHQLTQILMMLCYVSEKMLDFTEVLVGYRELMNLVFGIMTDVDVFYNDFMGMMDVSLSQKSTFWTRFKQKRKIKKFKKQMKLKFDDLANQMRSLTDFGEMVGGVMTSVLSDLQQPKKKKKGEPERTELDIFMEGLVNDAKGANSGNEGGSNTGTPGAGTSGNNSGSGSGVDTTGLF